MSEHVLIVEAAQAGARLDVFLAEHLPGCASRSAARRLIDEGAVAVNEQRVRPHYLVREGDRLRVQMESCPEPDVSLAPEEIALDILYEDDEILVINKPVGMLVHPVRGKTSGTLVNALLHHCGRLSALNDACRPGIVHRLDRETSGVMVVAKTDRAHAHLARQFEQRKVVKQYAALVRGYVELDEGRIDAPIGKHAVHFDKKAVCYDPLKGRPSVTTYKVVRRFGKAATLVDLFPKTGRTHQLRVHMKYLGHPVLGDDKYGSARGFPRLALHARSIRFRHPVTYAFLEFSVPLPDEFIRAEEFLAQ